MSEERVIVDELKNAQCYFVEHPLFQKAFAALEMLVEQKPEPGMVVVEEGKVIAHVVSGELRSEEEADLEKHEEFIDVHFLQQGAERLGWKSALGCLPKTKYDKENDLQFFSDTPEQWIDLRPGQFVVFYPSAAHVPMIGEGVVRKIILKVKF